MEVHLAPEKEAKLSQIAQQEGKDTAQLVQEAVDLLLDYNARFLAAVEEGRASARQGGFIEEEEMDTRVAGWFALS